MDIDSRTLSEVIRSSFTLKNEYSPGGNSTPGIRTIIAGGFEHCDDVFGWDVDHVVAGSEDVATAWGEDVESLFDFGDKLVERRTGFFYCAVEGDGISISLLEQRSCHTFRGGLNRV